MKSATLSLLSAVALLCGTAIADPDQTPTIPVGSLSAFPTIVQTGTKPQLTWEITLPETVPVVIEPPGTVKPKRCLYMDVRVLGASVKRVWTNNRGEVVDWEWVPTESRISYDGGSYERIFYDTHDNVLPDRIVHSQKVEKNSTINFGARYVQSNGSWATWYSSTNSSHNVVALRDGDTPPTTTPMYQQPTIESFILPYLDDDGNISLGPRDIIYLMELTHTDRNHGGFDLQDMALLLTFYDELETDEGTFDCDGNQTGGGGTDGGGTDDGGTDGGSSGNGNGNNGHGNNVDGVDSSNPGNSPHHDNDTDPNYDDERGRGRRKK